MEPMSTFTFGERRLPADGGCGAGLFFFPGVPRFLSPLGVRTPFAEGLSEMNDPPCSRVSPLLGVELSPRPIPPGLSRAFNSLRDDRAFFEPEGTASELAAGAMFPPAVSADDEPGIAPPLAAVTASS